MRGLVHSYNRLGSIKLFGAGHAFRRLALAFSLCAMLFHSGCRWPTPNKPSILVVAVEGLSEGLGVCHETLKLTNASGFHVLCQEAVRFTHAYTPSPLSQSGLASVLTGLYPLHHGVLNNGPDFLSARHLTAAEVAIDKGYRTAFFSGGPPIWRKSGLSQGMELFEDNVEIKTDRFFRPAGANFDIVFRWLQRLKLGEPFFTVVYIPDLQFPQVPTYDDLGAPRALTFQSQLKELDESLGRFITELKSRNLWDSTYVFLLGLNGNAERVKRGEIKGLNLFSDNTRVTLLMKPSRKKRDLGLNWKVDTNVTLVDVGQTIFDVLESQQSIGHQPRLAVTSLTEALRNPEVTWNKDRSLLIESGWYEWQSGGPIRSAIREGNYFIILGEAFEVFNTLTDRLEMAPLAETEPLISQLEARYLDFIRDHGLQSWNHNVDIYQKRIEVAQGIWRRLQAPREAFDVIQRQLENEAPDPVLVGWAANLALENRLWPELLELGQKYGNPMWKNLAQGQLGKKRVLVRRRCFRTVNGRVEFEEIPTSKECSDRLALKFIKWIRSSGSARSSHRREFVRSYRLHLIDQKIGQLNYVNGLLWDVNASWPAAPSLATLLLSLPEFEKQKKLTARDLAQ